MIHRMKTDRDTLCALLYRLADLVELAKRLTPEDRPALERMIAQVRQAVCEARRIETRKRTRLTTNRSIMLRILDKGADPKPELRSGGDDASS
jgi:hypothetical protein